MRKCRIAYGAAFLFSFAAFYASGSRFLLALCVLEALFPVCLAVLLRYETAQAGLSFAMTAACAAGQSLSCRFGFGSRRFFLAAGSLEITLELENVLFQKKMEETLRFPVGGTANGGQWEFSPAVCGEFRVRVTRAVCRDLFGLCARTLPLPPARTAAVRARTLSLQLLPGSLVSGQAGGERFSQNRRGHDASEVFDLREYQPGDDLRLVHWKLSGKMDSLILREASDESHYDTLVLFDAGRYTDGQEWDEDLLYGAVQLAETVCGRLLSLGLPHNMAIPANGELRLFPVSGHAELARMTDIWLGLPMQRESGMGLQCFLAERMEQFCTNVIYVTVGAYPPGLDVLQSSVDFTALCLGGSEEELRVSERGNGRYVELSLEGIRKNAYRIRI